jgi:nucleotide-binding universal stress UspA family protein
MESGVFTSIVVGTDGSAPAREAVRVAAEMARRDGAELHVVSAYRAFGDMLLIGGGGETTAAAGLEVEQQIRADVEAMLDDLAKELAAEGVAVTTHPSGERPVPAILDVAERYEADLIVVGNRGARDPKVLGSVPQKVVHLAPCSVLVVHTWPRRHP